MGWDRGQTFGNFIDVNEKPGNADQNDDNEGKSESDEEAGKFKLSSQNCAVEIGVVGRLGI